jgi:hypothetical protein
MAMATVAGVVLLLVGVALGLVAGRLQRQRGAHSAAVRLRHLTVLGLGTVANGVAYMLSGDTATVVLAGSLAVLLAFVGSNLHLTGMAVIGVGLLVNLVGVVGNDGVPVRGEALVAAGLLHPADLATTELLGARHLETSGDPLGFLGDVVPVRSPVAPEVMSFGDLIVVVGAADAMRELSRRQRRAWSAAERRSQRARDARLASLGAVTRPPVEALDGAVIDLTDSPAASIEEPVEDTAAPSALAGRAG